MGTPGEQHILSVFEKCAGASGCDVCRLHMEDDCLFFPELYRLSDQSEESGLDVRAQDLWNLVDLCTSCGFCPCQDIRMRILRAKASRYKEEGIALADRIISNVEAVGKWGSRTSRLMNTLKKLPPVEPVIKKVLNIHEKRELPVFPGENFFNWAKKRGLDRKTGIRDSGLLKVAYFAGCSTGYLYPEVGKAAVKVLEQTGVHVYVPPQQCCGMPSTIEGNKAMVFKHIEGNLKNLLMAAREGYDIVCSCSTCGYFFKKMLLENACYSDAYQAKMGSDEDHMKVPFGSAKKEFTAVPKKVYQKILKDEGYFSGLDPIRRIELSEKVFDLGEYLVSIRAKGLTPAVTNKPLDIPMIYYAPCHQQEQEIGQPYYHLLKELPGSDIIQTGGTMQCCGMGGHLGYKKSFHTKSIEIGNSLFKRLLAEKDRVIVTECLSCRIQFRQNLPMDVYHPIEMINSAYS